MSTNLVIGYADIPQAAEFSAVNHAVNQLYPYANLFGGNKVDRFYLDAEGATNLEISFALPVGESQAANFFYIAKANLLQQSGVTQIALKGNSTDNLATAVAVATYSSFNSEPLYGTSDEDFIDLMLESTPYRYWWVVYSSPTDSLFPHSKLLFGKVFDPGLDPNAAATITRLRIGGMSRESVFTFQFTWNGMTYDKAVDMYNTFYMTKRFVPLVLITRSWHDILMGHRAIFCRLTDMSLPPRITDYCNVTATFEELP